MSNTIIQDTTSAISDSTAVRDKKDLLDKMPSPDIRMAQEIGFYETPYIKRGPPRRAPLWSALVFLVLEKRSWLPWSLNSNAEQCYLLKSL
jgi:hypothetical protein